MLKNVRTDLPLNAQGLDHGAVPLLLHVARTEGRISALAGACRIDQSTASRYATHLAALGLVEKHTDPDDRRAQVIVLTEDGRRLVEEIREQRRTYVGELLSDWDVDDIELFDSQLRRLALAVERRHPRPCGTATPQEN